MGGLPFQRVTYRVSLSYLPHAGPPVYVQRKVLAANDSTHRAMRNTVAPQPIFLLKILQVQLSQACASVMRAHAIPMLIDPNKPRTRVKLVRADKNLSIAASLLRYVEERYRGSCINALRELAFPLLRFDFLNLDSFVLQKRLSLAQ